MSGSCAVEPRKVDAISTDAANLAAVEEEKPNAAAAEGEPKDATVR